MQKCGADPALPAKWATTQEHLVELSDGEIVVWIEQGSSVHIRAISKYGDPVELSAEEARHLARELLRLTEAVE